MKKSSHLILTTTEDHLIIEIDGFWRAKDFGIVFNSLDKLYIYNSLLNSFEEAYQSSKKQLSKTDAFNYLPEIQNLKANFYYNIITILNTEQIVDPHIFGSRLFFEGLSVTKVKFESPGQIDLLGIGKVFEQIIGLIKFYFPNSSTRAEHELLKVEKDKKNIENEILQQELLSKKIENFKNMGFDGPQIQSMIGIEYAHIDKLKTLIHEGKITAITIIEDTEVN